MNLSDPDQPVAPSAGFSRHALAVVSALLAVSVAITLLVVARPAVAVLTAAIFLLFVAPGVFVARAALGRELPG